MIVSLQQSAIVDSRVQCDAIDVPVDRRNMIYPKSPPVFLGSTAASLLKSLRWQIVQSTPFAKRL
jgi:hypothetical protein